MPHSSRSRFCPQDVVLAGKSPCTLRSRRSSQSIAYSCRCSSEIPCNRCHPTNTCRTPNLRRSWVEVHLCLGFAYQAHRNSTQAPNLSVDLCLVYKSPYTTPSLLPVHSTVCPAICSTSWSGNPHHQLHTAQRPNLRVLAPNHLAFYMTNSAHPSLSSQVPKASTPTCTQPILVLFRSIAFPPPSSILSLSNLRLLQNKCCCPPTSRQELCMSMTDHPNAGGLVLDCSSLYIGHNSHSADNISSLDCCNTWWNCNFLGPMNTFSLNLQSPACLHAAEADPH